MSPLSDELKKSMEYITNDGIIVAVVKASSTAGNIKMTASFNIVKTGPIVSRLRQHA